MSVYLVRARGRNSPTYRVSSAIHAARSWRSPIRSCRGPNEFVEAVRNSAAFIRSHEELIARDDIDLIDVCTPSATHFELAWAALEAGKHVLCEKPVAYDYRDTLRAAALAKEKGVKTKLGFTFRYSPAMQYMKALIDDGFVGTPFVFNGYEQNSQWLESARRRCVRSTTRPISRCSRCRRSRATARRSWTSDICFMGSRFTQVVGTMKNFIPERMVRATGTMMRMNIDDGDIFIGEFASGAIGSIQTSFVTVGNYPGIEARVYGSKGALICRLVEENGVCESLKGATADQVEFRDIEVPGRFYPPGGIEARVVALALLRESRELVHHRDSQRRLRRTRATSRMARTCRS